MIILHFQLDSKLFKLRVLDSFFSPGSYGLSKKNIMGHNILSASLLNGPKCLIWYIIYCIISHDMNTYMKRYLPSS